MVKLVKSVLEELALALKEQSLTIEEFLALLEQSQI